MRWLESNQGLHFTSYGALWEWSVSNLGPFWESVWQFFDVRASSPYREVLDSQRMPGTGWFVGSQLNYAQRALSRRDDSAALVCQSESSDEIATVTYRELNDRVASMAWGLRQLGVTRGDRVVSLLPNIPEAVIAFLAVASLGAIWSSCSPEFGADTILDRFQQIAPKVMFAVDSYQYAGRLHDRRELIETLQERLPTLEATVTVSGPGAMKPAPLGPRRVNWTDLMTATGPLTFEPVPFSHPLWILYSSGTTGLPKAIVHSHGGIVLEHLKSLSLHLDLSEADRFFWFTTTGWMMWNFLVGGLLVGATVLLYDGSPTHGGADRLWKFAQDARATFVGVSAPYIAACMRAGTHPGRDYDLSAVRSVGSTAAPLSPEGFTWVYHEVSSDLLLGSASGGTDVCTPFVGPCPLVPVYAGEIQCRCLGCSVEVFDDAGQSMKRGIGELVITKPMPSMPLFFWNDDGSRYRESYFSDFAGVWRHGDLMELTRHGGCLIHGRSDATLNRNGIRTGSSDYYRVVEADPEIVDSLVVDTSALGVSGEILLFIVVSPSANVEAVMRRAKERIGGRLSPRHVPDRMYAVDDVPRTLTGKKMEVPVRRILLGEAIEVVASRDAMSNPHALDNFAHLARARNRSGN